jgi:hypothetical protein
MATAWTLAATHPLGWLPARVVVQHRRQYHDHGEGAGYPWPPEWERKQ